MDYDAIVIGAGHNGLVAAAYLARAGRRVLVLERREMVGGACVTEEVWPGYHISTAAYLCSLLQPQIVADLELERYGLEIYRRETAGFAPFPDGRSLFLFPDASRTRPELERFCRDSPQDVAAYFEFEAEIERVAEIVEGWLLRPPPDAAERRAAFESRGLGHLYAPYMEGSVRDLLDARFRSPQLKAVLATDGLIGTYGGPETPGTAYVLLHHYLGRILGARGAWGYVRGGMGRITQALAQAAQAYGAQIRTSSPVAHLLIEAAKKDMLPRSYTGSEVESGRQTDPFPFPLSPFPFPLCVGVVLASGEEILAPAVLSNADPFHTIQVLAANKAEGEKGRRGEGEKLGKERRERVWPEAPPSQRGTSVLGKGAGGLGREGGPGNLTEPGKIIGASAKINLAVTELPRFTCLPPRRPNDPAGPEHLGTIHLCPDMDYLQRAWEEAAQGRPSTEPMIEMYIQTATDPSLSPPGRHILSLFVQYFPYNLSSNQNGAAEPQSAAPYTLHPTLYFTERERFTQRVIEIVGRYAPNVPGSILNQQTLTPRDLEARFGLTGGHIFHGDLLPPNLWDQRPGPGFHGAHTPIPGLYLCGSGAHPGGCVCGAPGYNAAHAVLNYPDN